MLPKNNAPRYTLKLPSSGLDVTYRPFLVKEEKIMLMAANSGTSQDYKQAIRQLIENCVETKLDIESLTTFDVEWILINLRIMSVGKKIDLHYTCNNVVEEKECGNSFPISIDIGEVKNEVKETPKNEIELGPNFGVKMKNPRFFAVYDMTADDYFDFDFMAECIEYVYDAKSVYTFKDQTKEEIAAFLDSLTKEQFDKLQEYLLKLPRFVAEKRHKCKKCGFEHTMEVRDLANFF